MYADDLNAYRVVPASATVTSAMASLAQFQQELHHWGSANQLTLDMGNESKYVVSRLEPYGDDFRVLGVIFDCRLDVEAAVRTLAGKMGWKVQMLLRSRKSLNSKDLSIQYKQQVPSFLE